MFRRNIQQSGFTLMEVVVATTLFATTLTLMLSLFNYTLKINRRTEALRQVTQGMRNFTEFIAKEVRNGRIDYSNNIAACSGNYSSASGYTSYLKLINADNENECFMWSGSTPPNDQLLYLYKDGVAVQTLNPTNFKVEFARFFVRPTCDPSTQCATGVYPAIQPYVTIMMRFKIILPTGETRTIPYQTTISTDQYDTPDNNP